MKKLTALVLLCTTVPYLLLTAACSDNDRVVSPAGGGKSSVAAGSSVAGASLAGAAGSAGAADGAEEFLMVDDFEDGDSQPLLPGGWYSYNDVSNGGASKVTFTGAADGTIAMNGVGYQSLKSLEVDFAFDQGTLTYDPFVGWGASLATAASPIDLSAYTGIAYEYQGNAHRARVENASVTDYDEFGTNIAASAAWKTVTLPFSMLAQEGWGKKVSFDPSRCTNISFAARGASGSSGKVNIDNLRLVKNIAKGPPNMSVNPAAPPANGTLATLDIPNPLQQKALKYLTRGYNITNWLEQVPFAGFTYDEAFVQKLALAGFKSLRLPIDLDNYVESKTGSGDTLSITVKPELFTILDSFDTWTKANGLSLTIDYHQYSSLLDKSDADSIGTAVQLWGKVAEHFATNPREDIFFELCNEPELSFTSAAPPTAAEWGALAERMIAAIRTTDTTHSVIFGDVQWYGIDTLAARKVLSDTNVIYAFHDYDPFIFTHQGTGWTALVSVHDIPYPYVPERWSQYYASLGFSPLMESWILSAAQTYYRDGSKAALRNRVLTAKRWAVTNNVPVICNEFGAYDGTSKLADRVNYYTDIVGIFEELGIPWQHWFMIVNSAGAVAPPEYATAMHLGQ